MVWESCLQQSCLPIIMIQLNVVNTAAQLDNVASNEHLPNISQCQIKLMKGKALWKNSLHEKTAASVLLKLFISGNEWCHTTDAP